MVLMLGVAKALKAMHQYRVRSNNPSSRKAKAERREGEPEDPALQRGKPKRRPTRLEVEEHDEQQEPLMDDEVTQSQEGVEEGGIRPYAHRDIKPGRLPPPPRDILLSMYFFFFFLPSTNLALQVTS
jgi:serine/threonine kinase 16